MKIICDECGCMNLDLEGFGEGYTVYACEDCGCFIEVENEE